MTVKDKSVECSECGRIFTFTAGEQRFYFHRGPTRAPRRGAASPAERAAQEDGGSNAHGSGWSR